MNIHKKHILLLNSKDRSSGTVEDAVFHLNENDLHESHSVMLKDIVIPNTIYNIRTTNNTLDYDINGVGKSVNIPVGHYSLSDLITALNTAQTDLVFSNNTFQKKLDVSSASNSFIKVSSTIKKVIGVTVQNTPATNYTLDSFYNLNPTNYIHVISNLAEQDALVASNNKKYAVIASIPVLYGFGFVLNQTEDRYTQDNSKHNSHLNLSTINLRLCDDDFQTIDLNGSEWSISLSILKS
jgi:hypothetical protein